MTDAANAQLHDGIGLTVAVLGFSLTGANTNGSAVAFALTETADLAVFTPLQRRGLVLAVAASGAVGILVESMLFLWLAFGSLDFLPGQVIGKSWALVAALPLIHLLRLRDRRLGLSPA